MPAAPLPRVRVLSSENGKREAAERDLKARVLSLGGMKANLLIRDHR